MSYRSGRRSCRRLQPRRLRQTCMPSLSTSEWDPTSDSVPVILFFMYLSIAVLRHGAREECHSSSSCPLPPGVNCRVAEKAAEVEGRFGLAEVQAEALMVAATALLQHVAEGKAQALEVVELARVEEEAGGQAPARKARGRRKSTWR